MVNTDDNSEFILVPSAKAVNMSTVRLIDIVYSYPMLYQLDHHDYKNVKKKERIWETIATELNEPSDVLKRKWKNLKDSYVKYLAANNCPPGQDKKPYSSWKWSAMMEKFRPFVNPKPHCNISFHNTTTDVKPPLQVTDDTSFTDNIDQQDEEDNDEPEQEEYDSSVLFAALAESEMPPAKKRKVATVTDTDKVLEYFESKAFKEMDDVDHMMIGFAKTIKKLSRRRQIIARKRIMEIVSELELEELEECG